MTLTPTDTAKRLNTPPLQGRGRGWGLPANTIATLQTRARDMRNNPTEPEKRLWRRLSNAQLDGWKFRRQQVIGHYIADVVCPAKRLMVEIDGHTHDTARDAVRDARLSALGYHVLRFNNGDVMHNAEGVLRTTSAVLETLPERRPTRPHPNPSPEGEGLPMAVAQKLLGISLEGSVG